MNQKGKIIIFPTKKTSEDFHKNPLEINTFLSFKRYQWKGLEIPVENRNIINTIQEFNPANIIIFLTSYMQFL